MKQEYNDLFAKAAPRMSDEELLNSVLSGGKGNIMKNEKRSNKHISKAIVIPLAAALAVGATAVGAVAVYNYNVSEQYAQVLQLPDDAFKQEYKTADGEEINLNAVALNTGLYDELNIELNKSFEYEDFTIDFPGAVCDGRDILVMFNMTFKKDLDCLKIEDQDFWIFGENTRNIDGLLDGTRTRKGMISEVDGKTVYSGYVDYSGVENCGDSLNLHFEDIRASGSSPARGIDEYRVGIDVDLEIPLTGDIAKFNKTVEASEEQHVDILGWGDWNVEGFEISPLMVTFNVKAAASFPDPNGNIFKTSSPVFPVNVTMKDGSTLELGSDAICRYGDDVDTKTAWFMAVFNYPLNVEDVQSVQFASTVIDIDGNAKTIEIPEVYEKYDENGRPVDR